MININKSLEYIKQKRNSKKYRVAYQMLKETKPSF